MASQRAGQDWATFTFTEPAHGRSICGKVTKGMDRWPGDLNRKEQGRRGVIFCWAGSWARGVVASGEWGLGRNTGAAPLRQFSPFLRCLWGYRIRPDLTAMLWMWQDKFWEGEMFEKSMIICITKLLQRIELNLVFTYLEECPRYIWSENFKSLQYVGHKPSFEWIKILIIVILVILVVVTI